MEMQDSLINELLENIKSNTIVKERYELLINFIMESTALGYSDKTKLRIADDYKVMDLIKILEQEKYNIRLKELNNEEEF